ncbi:hypothetical protein Q1695_013746 [Nippostrongylus brasiliensis]|nr:hypothetical protein Q1695_013746 [Nippostrongylus brasiliensis]
MVDKCLAEDSEEQEPSCADDTCCVCLSRVAVDSSESVGGTIDPTAERWSWSAPGIDWSTAPVMFYYASEPKKCRFRD